jgi:hypothetical protein
LKQNSSTASLAGVLLYYVGLGGALWASFKWVPGWAVLFSGNRLRSLNEGDQELLQAFERAQGATSGVSTAWDTAAMAMIGALLIVIPVAWVYTITKRREGYDPSVVQTIIILPVAVAGIVLIVQSSLALAFSLAGIVAAVRFRNTLDDTKDAVYVFLAIGVGLSAGAQAFGAALTMSVVFNLVILALWRFNVGNIYEASISALPNDPSLPSMEGIELPYQGILRVASSDLRAAGKIVEEILDRDVKKWQTLPSNTETGALDYLVRFKKKKNPPKEVLTTLQQRGTDIDLRAEFIPLGD